MELPDKHMIYAYSHEELSPLVDLEVPDMHASAEAHSKFSQLIINNGERLKAEVDYTHELMLKLRDWSKIALAEYESQGNGPESLRSARTEMIKMETFAPWIQEDLSFVEEVLPVLRACASSYQRARQIESANGAWDEARMKELGKANDTLEELLSDTADRILELEELRADIIAQLEEYTAKDYPLSDLTQEELEELLLSIGVHDDGDGITHYRIGVTVVVHELVQGLLASSPVEVV